MLRILLCIVIVTGASCVPDFGYTADDYSMTIESTSSDPMTLLPYTHTPTPNVPTDDCGCTHNSIWLDIMLVIDSSSSMTNTGLETLTNYILTAAGRMSIGQKLGQVSRIGTIVYAEDAVLVNNLTDFTSVDNMYDNFNPSYLGTSGSNLEAAIKLASNAFNGPTHRTNAKKVIVIAASHYEPGTSNDPVQIAETFKGDGGVIVTVEYVQVHGAPIPILSQLATSACYQLSNRAGELNANDLLDVFCKANCFCAPQWFSYTVEGQCMTPQGRCFFPVALTSNMRLADRFCKYDKGGSLPKITDMQKALFLANLSRNKQPTWLGLKYNGFQYVWDDGTPLGNYHPFSIQSSSKQCVYQQQTTGFRVNWFSADCMQEDYMYSCEAAPCSTDKYCS